MLHRLPILIAFALTGFLASCDGQTAVEKATKQKILLLGNSSEPKGLDPHLVSGVLESNIIRALFEGLCVEHPSKNGTALPGAAASWEHSDDYTEWIFHLQPDAKWSDGNPVTAEDFLFSFKRILTPALGSDYSFMLYYIEDAEAYHKSQRAYLVTRDDPEFPVEWETLSKVDFGPNAKIEDKESFNAKGLDRLDAAQLEKLKADPSLFEWPEDVPQNVRDIIIEKSLAFAKSGRDLWELIRLGATAPDPHTLKVKLRAPIPFLPELTKHYTWYPVPKHIVLKYGKSDNRFSEWTKPGNLVSNGPFTLKSWRINDHIEVEKNPTYWDAETVQLNGIRYFPTQNVYTEARMFFAKELHVTYTLAPELIDHGKKEYPENFRNELYMGTRFLRCNVARKPLDDPRVRMALSYAIDRDSIIDNVLHGGQKPALGMVPPFGSYRSPALVKYDPEYARELLAEAGFPGGEGFPELRFLTTDSESAKRLSEAYQGMWKQNLGIRIGIDQQDWGSYLNSTFEKNYDISGGGWIADYLDPTTFLDMWQKDGGNNRTNWSDAEFDKLLREAERTADPEARFRILEKAEKIFLEQRPVIPIFWYTRNYLISDKVKGWHPLLLDNHPYKFIHLGE